MKKGFTLLELLIVIGILAILSSVAVLVLNPAELLRQARDSQRINDLAAINNALAIYAATVDPLALGTSGNAYTHNTTSSNNFFGATCGGSGAFTGDVDRTVDSTGWIPVDFTDIPGGSPFSILPIDPSNTSGATSTQLLYWYKTDETNWELNVRMESARYQQTGSDPIVKEDGGTCDDAYEIGTDPALDL